MRRWYRGSRSPDDGERPCSKHDASAIHCNSARRIAGPDASVPRPGRRYGRCTRDGSIRSASRRSRFATASLAQSACHGCPWPESAGDGGTVGPVPIADQVARGLIPRESLGDLTCNPFRGRVCSDVDPDKVSAFHLDDDENIEQVEANGWDNEQVCCGDRWFLVEGPDFFWVVLQLAHGCARPGFKIGLVGNCHAANSVSLEVSSRPVRLDCGRANTGGRKNSRSLPCWLSTKSSGLLGNVGGAIDDQENRALRRRPSGA